MKDILKMAGKTEKENFNFQETMKLSMREILWITR